MLQQEMEERRLERLVRPEEVRALLGISERVFYRFTKEGIIPTVRVEGCVKGRCLASRQEP